MDGSPWMEAALVALLSLGALALGRVCSRLPGRWWLVGYILPLCLIVLIGVGRRAPGMEFHAPISWLLAGRTEFLLGGLSAAWILATPCSRLKTARERGAILAFIGFFVSVTTVWPFLAPAFNRPFWNHAMTRIDANGICLQATDYSCGPAAAVTALRRLGVLAEERDIAIAAHTSNAIGTPPDLLVDAIRGRYGARGFETRHRYFDSIADLNREPGVVTLAVIRFALFVDHYVAVLHVDAQRVVVGDPAVGLRVYTPEEFDVLWRRTGVELWKRSRP